LDYYVVDFDFDNAENHVQFWEQVYTGFTRAKKGVIFNVIGDENVEFDQIDSEDI
jgi:hypothetical protein